MKRRDFLKITAGGAAGLAASGAFMSHFGAADAPNPGLVVAHGASPEKTTRAALESLGGMKRFVSRGDIVVVKPNIGWDRLPEHAACTNPAVVAALVAMCVEAGAKTVKVFDRSVNDPRRCYVQSGIEAAAKAAGAEVSYVNERKFKEVAIKGGESIKSWPLYTDLMEADKIINVPIAKHHSLSKLTMAFKNWMGVMGSSRGMIHQSINESLADLGLVIKPALTVLDAVRILTAHGPQGGNLSDVKKLDTVIASADQVAVDAYGATLFGLKGSDLGYVVSASRRGLGVMDLDRVQIRKIEA